MSPNVIQKLNDKCKVLNMFYFVLAMETGLTSINFRQEHSRNILIASFYRAI